MLRLPRRVFCVAATLALASLSVNARQTPGGDPRVEAIRYWSFGDVTRIAIETQGDYKITSDSLAKPPRLFFDLRGLRPPASKRKGMQIIQVNDHRVKQIRVAETEPGVTRIVLDLAAPSDFTSSQLVTPDRLIIELHPKGSGTAEPAISRTISGVERVRLDESDTISTTSQALPPITGVPAEPTRLPFVSQPDLWA